MRQVNFRRLLILPTAIGDLLRDQWTPGKPQLPRYLFLGLCLNLALAPAVWATTGGDLSRTQAYWVGALGLVTVALSIYLFAVMFFPEKF